jgi:adenosylcobinamide-GDP ribazoletransferase
MAVATVARRPLHDAAHAVCFLTVIPVRLPAEVGPLGAAAAWFPLVGALVGALAGATRLIAEPLLGPTVATILAVVVLVAVTGALHQDGLADCADGLGVRGDRERRLEVMRDSAIGTFGALALLAWAGLVVAALAALDDGQAASALVTAAVAGRWAVLVHATTAPPARPDGLGASFDVSAVALALATVVAIAGAILLEGPVDGLAAVAAAAVTALVASAHARRSLGGRTGDTLGATVAVAELAVCLTLLALA